MNRVMKKTLRKAMMWTTVTEALLMWTTEARASVLVDDGGQEYVMWTTDSTKMMWMKSRLLRKEGSIFVNVFPEAYEHI